MIFFSFEEQCRESLSSITRYETREQAGREKRERTGSEKKCDRLRWEPKKKGKANRTRCFNPFSRKLLTVAVGVEWLNRRVRYVIGVHQVGTLLHRRFVDWSPQRLQKAKRCTQRPRYTPLYAIPSISLMGSAWQGRPSPWVRLSLTAYHLSLPCCPDGVLTLDPEPVTAFFSSTWYGLDGLLEEERPFTLFFSANWW